MMAMMLILLVVNGADMFFLQAEERPLVQRFDGKVIIIITTIIIIIIIAIVISIAIIIIIASTSLSFIRRENVGSAL